MKDVSYGNSPVMRAPNCFVGMKPENPCTAAATD
jgi:hypothetical protein